jgi:drug/metabolite transporter (DMT)-like permease
VTPGAYLLVILSAAAHACWNFLLKRSAARQEVVGLSKIVEAFLLGVLLLTGIGTEPALLPRAWLLPVVGAALSLLNYVLLTTAYRHGELSLVYPMSRGAMLAFVPPLAFVVFGERLDAMGWFAIAIIVGGIALLHGRAVSRTPAPLFALLAALAAAAYTVWDKRAVQVLSPLTYFAAYTVLVGVAYAGVIRRWAPRGAALHAWRSERGAIVAVALLNSASYLLVLIALQEGKASYVIALRQLSIAAGALLGAGFLHEVIPTRRRVGIALVVAGCALLGLAR